MSAASLLSVEGLSKRFGGVVAAENVSFTVAPGELLAIIGPNGAGKSTVFNMVGGQLAPDAGRVLLGGQDISRLPPQGRLRAGVGRTFQVAQTFLSMTVAENVQMALIAARGGASALWPAAPSLHREEAVELLARLGMEGAAERPCATLAYGDLKRVELALALAAAPRLLLMDEPTAGMAGPERRQLMELAASTARTQGLGVLFTEHDVAAVFAHADRVLVLVRGRVIAAGSPNAVRADPAVQAAYLGTGTLKRRAD